MREDSTSGRAPSRRPATGALRRWLARFGWFLAGGALALVGAYVWSARQGPALSPWHTLRFEHELEGDTPGVDTLADYLLLEGRLFAEVEEKLAPAARGIPFSRFDPGSATWPGRFERNWDRTWEIVPEHPVAGALLLHGLSDSPYSLRALGEVLASEGCYVLALRLPGHGTAPAGLVAASRQDWRRAVRLAARAVAERVQGRPFVIAGYSNGAALAVDYALEAAAAADDTKLPRPQRLVLLSPALALSRLAAAAAWQRRLSVLPGLHQLGWIDVLPEYDPWKYNSFPIEAAEQLYHLTSEIGARAARFGAGPSPLPPVLAFQSMVDDTVPASISLPALEPLLRDNGSELVLFDVNRLAQVEYFLRPDILALAGRVGSEPHPFALTIVTNRSAQTAEVVARRREPGNGAWMDSELGLEWPSAMYSLSHVALPFPQDDPFYGAGSGAGGPFPLGRLEPRGERAALSVPITLLVRLRYNPFFPVIAERVGSMVRALAGAQPARSGPPGSAGH